MSTNNIKKRIQELKKEYDKLSQGKESFLNIIDEAEVPESVYNSNAIENSTLSLKETEKILLQMELSRNVDLREVFEAKNLAQIIGYMKKKEIELSRETILFLHQMLMTNINDEIAGRFRKKGEYVRVGTYIAPAPEKVERMIGETIINYKSNLEQYFLDKIAKFHLDFENIHAFNDGNGRIGRVLINIQLKKFGFPCIIIRDKEKDVYYRAFADYRNKNAKTMEKIIYLALAESLHKRIAYLKNNKIVALSDHIRKHKKSAPAVLNSARRQTIPAFREKGVWKISDNFKLI